MNTNSINIVTRKGNPDAVLVNESSLPTGTIYKNRHLLRNIKHWHRFCVTNTDGLERNEVLKAILDHVHPLDLIPVFFRKDSTQSNSYFLARNCEFAIDKLCNENLVVDHPWNKKSDFKKYTPFKISILLNFSNTNEIKIDVQKNVMNVLQKRFDPITKVLDLTKFYEDPDLEEFCPLSQPKIMYFVLHISKSFTPDEIIFQDNEIKMLNPLDVLVGMRIRSIDLSHNLIAALSDLQYLNNLHVKELNLDGNPLCNTCDEEKYIQSLRAVCPYLEILDGLNLSQGKFPIVKKTYLCDRNGFDLVNQFVEHFFTVFDSRNRAALENIYHENACFSLTTHYHPMQVSSKKAQLKTYTLYSRNLLKAADLSRTSTYLYRGKINISELIMKKLPEIEHDPYSLSVDLTHYTPEYAHITVNGVYREVPETMLDSERLLGFCRSFVLKISKEFNHVLILNDIFHVYNALNYQRKTSFVNPKEMAVVKDVMPKPATRSDQDVTVATLMTITNLREKWARKCLAEVNHDLKRGLELFVDLYKSDKIPKDAFVAGSPDNSEDHNNEPPSGKTARRIGKDKKSQSWNPHSKTVPSKNFGLDAE